MVNTMDGRNSFENLISKIKLAKYENGFAVIELNWNYNDEQFFYDMMDFEYKYGAQYLLKFKSINNNNNHISCWPDYKIYVYRRQ